jgi:hypothetical protein
MAHVLLILSALIAFGGGVLVLLIWLCWKWVEWLIRGSLAKPVIAGCRFCVLVTGLLARYPDGNSATRSGWWIAISVTAGIGWLLWEVVDWWGAEKLKAEKATVEQAHLAEIGELQARVQEATAEAGTAKRQALFRVKLLTALRLLAREKSECIHKELGEPSGRTKPELLRSALSPARDTAFALDQLALFFYQDLPPAEDGTSLNIRVCLYVDSGGRLEPLDGFDFQTRKRHPFSSYLNHERRFHLDNREDPAHAVRCVQRKSLLVVPDCAADANFHYFDEGQRTYLKSMAAYPIMEFRRVPEVRAAALVVDANRPGYFREQDRAEIAKALEEFAARLVLESAILRVVSIYSREREDANG